MPCGRVRTQPGHITPYPFFGLTVHGGPGIVHIPIVQLIGISIRSIPVDRRKRQ